MLASETCALDGVGATFFRDVEPGEVVVIDADGLTSERSWRPARERPPARSSTSTSSVRTRGSNGRGVHAVRREMGRLLARQRPTDADVVIGVPDSAIAAATGFAEEAGLPYADGFVRNRYIGRTFIEPTPRLRKLGARLKYNVLPEVTRGKRVVVLDDSIVRGTTQRQLVGLLRDIGGAAEVHVRITAPPVRWPCFLGIDIPDPAELIASELTSEEIRGPTRRRQPRVPERREPDRGARDGGGGALPRAASRATTRSTSSSASTSSCSSGRSASRPRWSSRARRPSGAYERRVGDPGGLGLRAVGRRPRRVRGDEGGHPRARREHPDRPRPRGLRRVRRGVRDPARLPRAVARRERRRGRNEAPPRDRMGTARRGRTRPREPLHRRRRCPRCHAGRVPRLRGRRPARVAERSARSWPGWPTRAGPPASRSSVARPPRCRARTATVATISRAA